MALPHTYNPVFTASSTTPPASGDEMITIPYAGARGSSTENTAEVGVTFSNTGTLSFTGFPLDAILPWGSGGSGTNIDSAGWYETKTSTLTPSDFEIAFSWSPASFQTVLTGPTALTENTYYSLGTTRFVEFSHFENTSFQRINSGTLSCSIRLASSSVVVCYKSLTMITRINEP